MNSFENHASNSSMDMFLEEVQDAVFYPVKILGLLYTFSCVFFLLYIIRDTNLQLKKKKKMISRTTSDQHVYLLNEQLVRNVIILIFLFFETTFSTFGFIFGMYNLSLSIFSDYGQFDMKTGYDRFITPILSNLISFSFSMMLCLFGVSILQLSYAAKNQLNVRNLIKFILIGSFANLVILIANYVFPRIIYTFIHISLYHITLIVALYIAKRRFFPAMNSRIIDAYHLHLPNTDGYLKQKSYLKRYKKLIPFILVTFELYVFKDTLLFLNYANHLTGWYPHLYNVEYYLLFLMPIVDCIVFFNLTLVNFAYISSILITEFKSLFSTKTFRYQLYSAQSDEALVRLKIGLLPDVP